MGGGSGGGGEDGDLASKVDRRNEMVIMDEGLALQIMGGDLSSAVDLSFSGRVGRPSCSEDDSSKDNCLSQFLVLLI